MSTVPTTHAATTAPVTYHHNRIIDMLALILGSACCVVGSALLWRSYREESNDEELERGYQYENLAFLLAMIVALIYYFSNVYDPEGRIVWRFVFYGIVFFITVLSLTQSLQETDNNREALEDDEVDSSVVEKRFAGQVIGYSGLLLLMFAVNGPFRYKGFLSILLWLIALVLGIIGCIILWNLENNASPLGTNRDTVFWITSTLITALAFSAASVFHGHPAGAYTASFIVGFASLWYLSQGFYMKNNDDIDPDTEEKDEIWAGTLFCWFSGFVILVCCRFAAANLAPPPPEVVARSDMRSDVPRV